MDQDEKRVLKEIFKGLLIGAVLLGLVWLLLLEGVLP